MKIERDKFYRLTVVADSGDADFVTNISKVSGAEIEDYITPLINALETCSPGDYNWYRMWGNDRCSSPEEIYDLDEDIIGYYEECCSPNIEGGTHTINSISISKWNNSVTLFKN